MTPDDIRTLLYRGVAWYSREQVQVLLEAYDGAQAQREFEKQAYAKDRDARDRISREVVDHLIAERDAQAQPAATPLQKRHWKHGNEYGWTATVMEPDSAQPPVAEPGQPVNVEGPEHLAPRPAPGLVFDAHGVLAPAQPPDDAPLLTYLEIEKLIDQTSGIDWLAKDHNIRLARAVEAEVRRRMGVTK